MRVFSKNRMQIFITAMRIPVYFALIHRTFLALVNEFDRILNGQYVFVFCVVDVIHHGSEGRAPTRAARPSYRNQSTRDFRNLMKNSPMPGCSMVRTSEGIVRNTAAAPRF